MGSRGTRTLPLELSPAPGVVAKKRVRPSVRAPTISYSDRNILKGLDHYPKDGGSYGLATWNWNWMEFRRVPKFLYSSFQISRHHIFCSTGGLYPNKSFNVKKSTVTESLTSSAASSTVLFKVIC
ncbi:hypothetical protein RvY_11281 [Ramazzottius varieornatus]|uniref:Uncharacterized protein n=1 Tax=Ramazzottius varieornatus TaxID=947166 RepID=A0A1D1VNC8_RAMVA|nr:hypothetical protein RvY_11281 [Ramazzottius varieornatus]